jgi:hypothetical protein
MNIMEDQGLNQLCKEVEQDLCKYDGDMLRDNEVARREIAASANSILERIPQ